MSEESKSSAEQLLTPAHGKQIEALTRAGVIQWRIGEDRSDLNLQRTTWSADLRQPGSVVKLKLVWCRDRLLPPAAKKESWSGPATVKASFDLLVQAVTYDVSGAMAGVQVIGTMVLSVDASFFEAVEHSVAGQIVAHLEASLAAVTPAPSSAPFCSHWMSALDVDGWRAVFYGVTGEPIADDVEPGDRDIRRSGAVRWEQWFVGSELCVFVARDAPGETWDLMALVEEDHGLRQVSSLADLYVLMEDDDGVLPSPAQIHPVLHDYAEQHPHTVFKAREAHKTRVTVEYLKAIGKGGDVVDHGVTVSDKAEG